MEAEDYDVVEAENGVEAVEFFTERAPGMVLLDVEMPGIDGFAVCRALRQMPGAQFVPIVMMTGRDDIGSIEQAYDAGATDFLTKPVNFALLPHRVSYLHRAGKTLCELRQSERRLTSAQRLAQLGSWELDLEARRLHVSREAREILGLRELGPAATLEQLLTRVPPAEKARVLDAFTTAEKQRIPCGVEHRVILPERGERIIYQQVELHRAGAQDHTIITGTAQDVTERSRAEKKIFDLAHFDSITGLPNRTLLRKTALVSMRRANERGDLFAMWSIGLDRFQRINDSCGHDNGDKFLQAVAKRLTQCVHESKAWANAEHATVARMGGDEFALCMPVKDQAEAEAISKELLEAISAPVELDDDVVVVTASIGVALDSGEGDDLIELLKNAEQTMHYLKRTGGAGLGFHSATVDEAATMRLKLENGLRLAIDGGAIEVWYQPKVDAKTGRVVGVEALCRWRDPERGLIPPNDFIPLAEDTGLIERLGLYVLESACASLKKWKTDGYDLTLAVNLSPKQFGDPRLADSILERVARAGLSPSDLEVEITESALIHHNSSCRDVLGKLKHAGVNIAIDDFGTGYASLSNLKQFPIDIVKIDRSFVMDITANTESAVIADAILGMSLALGKSCVAEGVETREQLDYLRERGCHSIQGFFYSPPVPAEDLDTLLAEPTSRRTA